MDLQQPADTIISNALGESVDYIVPEFINKLPNNKIKEQRNKGTREQRNKGNTGEGQGSLL